MKKIWRCGLLMAGVLAAAVVGHQAMQTESNGIFYRISGGKSTVYLLGSIHVGARDMYPMSKNIRSALQASDTVVFECDTSGEDAQNASARLMKSEVDLEERVTPECLRLVEQAARKLGYSMETLRKLDPWAITSMITVAAAADEMNGGNKKLASVYGVENMVRKQMENQKVEYLETAEEQLGLMEKFSPELQEYLLVSACRTLLESSNVNEQKNHMEKWPIWWKEGNAQAFAESYLREMEDETAPELAREYHQALLSERNHRMAEKLCQMLENDQERQYFVVVGLMHLVLENDSILCELEDAGYCVEKIAQ